ncbi:DEAD/DEAH box helicase [Aquabacterium sp. OR-4]|uniref:DEAD/DEAH box helicase n=1 Tax=Aquabacterium sp. OR-4 TaxID=2978127 RepID=UPI0028C870B4|nr:DEAD/DEAH box helicase [Aquabacterium sp. OR-4]MDT7838809.1 DEAD/DEAH box helicase [Aquabacterium sp. OR-4]
MTFPSLGLLPALVDALARTERTEPTPIQAQAIPAVLAGRDLLAQAPTGSGKTLAYALPLLQQALRGSSNPQHQRDPAALVLVPTRELAQQVGEVLRALVRALPPHASAWRSDGPPPPRLRVAVLQGGVSINPQLMALRGGADIVVATPGRVLDVVAHNGLHLDRLKTLVLDEADRLLALGFADELDRVLGLLPAQRQNLLFSATYGQGTGGAGTALQAVAERLLQDPVQVRDESAGSQPPAAIQQRAIVVDTTRRTPLLRHLLAELGQPRTLVFVATRHATEMVTAKLARAGVKAAALHGELSQGTRWRVLDGLGRGEFHVLVATDVAARGLDIPDLALVVNHDLPRSADDHVHRIGRTGRAGASGLAISLVPPGAEAHFRLIEKRQGQRVPREVLPGFEPTEVPAPQDPTGGVKGKRKSKKDRLREQAAARPA